MRILPLLFCVLSIVVVMLAVSAEQVAAQQPTTSRKAYVTLLCAESFMIGIRVLNQSLKNHKSAYPFVVLVTPQISQQARDKMASEGIIIKEVELIENPNKHLMRESWRCVYTKLQIWSLEDEFDDVIFLDADMVLRDNIDKLFKCKGFCAVHDLGLPDTFNTGLMKFSPNKQTYNELITKLKTLSSYDSGDQGYLNHFYDFRSARRFDPDSEAEQPEGIWSLSFGYNCEVPIWWGWPDKWFDLHNDGLIKVIHFNNPFKPWTWYMMPMMDIHFEWYWDFRTLPNQIEAAEIPRLLFHIVAPYVLTALLLYAITRLPFTPLALLRKLPAFMLRPIRPYSTVPFLLHHTNNFVTIALPFAQFTDFRSWDPFLVWGIFYGWVFFSIVFSCVTWFYLLFYKIRYADQLLPAGSGKELSSGNSSAAMEKHSNQHRSLSSLAMKGAFVLVLPIVLYIALVLSVLATPARVFVHGAMAVSTFVIFGYALHDFVYEASAYIDVLARK